MRHFPPLGQWPAAAALLLLLASCCLSGAAAQNMGLPRPIGPPPPPRSLLSQKPSASCGCDACEALLEREVDYSGTSLEDLDRRLTCHLKANATRGGMCKDSCKSECRASIPRHTPKADGEDMACETSAGGGAAPRQASQLSLSQLNVASRLLSGCPQPQPCVCSCWCPPAVYGTPYPVTPGPYNTPEPPQLSLFLQTAKQRSGLQHAESVLPPPPSPLRLAPAPAPAPARKKASSSLQLGGESSKWASMWDEADQAGLKPVPKPLQVSTLQTEEATAADDMWAPQILLGPPPLPPSPAPLAPDRSFCPKSAGCNCFCPCRE